ncbi:MAG: GAF domain-containing protein [Chloroflexi bacterium CFX1]|nr:GAF domain-containing protein [Chloroflexi bacterium CFX1]MCQ3952635.1 hypothetical protein [Chloroflexota bacterium]MDL1920257.1 GAF domain-containing protein [Chloroflexi bacterium CFX5]
MTQSVSPLKKDNVRRGSLFEMTSLRARLLAATILLALVPLLITSAAVTYISSQGLRQDVFDQLESVVTLKNIQVNAWLESLQTNLDLVLVNPASLDRISTTLSSPDANDIAQVRRELTEYNRRSGYFTELFIMDAEGRVIVSTDDVQEGKILTTQPFFQEGLKAPYTAPPTYDLSLASYSIVISQPLKNGSGDLIGVLAGRANLDVLSEIMQQRAGLGETGETYVVSSNFAVLTSLRFSETAVGQTYIHTNGATDAIKNRTNGSGIYLDYRGIETVGVYHWIPELQVAILAEHTESEALQAANRVIQTTLGLIFITILAAGLAAFQFTQRVSAPIVNLARAAENISQGNLDQRVDVAQRDEIGILAASFNAMTFRLKELIGSLEQRVVERTQALSTVAEVSAAASVILETDKLLQEVNDLTKERFGFYHAHIYLLDAEEKNLVLASGAGEAGRRMVAEGRSIPLDREQSLVARAARERKGVIVNDVTQAPDFLPNPLLPDTRSELAVPMIVGENLVGVFDVQSDQVGRFTQSDADIQTTLAAQIASSVQNARLFSRAQSALAQSEKLFEGSRRIAQTDDLQETMNSLLELIDIPIINGALLLTHNRDSQNNIESVDIVANWWSGVGDPVYPVGARFSIADTPGLEAFVSPENLFFRDIYADQRTQGNMQESGIRSIVVLPLFIGSKQIGAFSLLGMQPYDFTQDEIQLFLTLAPQIAAKLENRRQFERAQKQAERETMLNAISQKIQSAATLESALQVAARELGHALGGKPTLVELELADNPSGQENAQKESLA